MTWGKKILWTLGEGEEPARNSAVLELCFLIRINGWEVSVLSEKEEHCLPSFSEAFNKASWQLVLMLADCRKKINDKHKHFLFLCISCLQTVKQRHMQFLSWIFPLSSPAMFDKKLAGILRLLVPQLGAFSVGQFSISFCVFVVCILKKQRYILPVLFRNASCIVTGSCLL